ncbi:MgtC/SapB family protein [Sinirhodobacter huangdaonensis]|uniref:DUF4010 domain-containing protein n=1 Tax=Paenirhodobacter huangdaonensis TaxID=2501515 RepID=A0A443M081_9RHOB|nr:MgtC/SapB family protein [Sinirhodobacter huangdaonensis]RWR54915.1 DUF4010 domain-containing protein [Sinirhodobacter huangdaonensis]
MDETMLKLGVALAIGLLVGVERGWRERDEPSGSRTAGLRTYGIFGLLGGVFAAVSLALGSSIVLGAAFLGFAALFGLFEYRESRHDENFSVTGLMAGLGVFGLGALAVVGDYRVAAAGGTALAGILASREMLHSALRRLSWVELRSALVLAAMTVIVLPLLPDRTIDPWGGFNPREVWFFTVLIATISYLGYIAVRMLGTTRGLIVSGLAGALVSSTAVTVALARMAKEAERPVPLAGAAALAALVSVLRVTVVVGLIGGPVLVQILPVTATAAAVLALVGGLVLARAKSLPEGSEMLRNPFELRALLAFAALFACVSMLNAALSARFGGSGLLVTSAASGIFDVDVAVLSALRLTGETFAPRMIGAAVLMALVSNTVGRIFLSMLAGPLRFWLALAAISALAVAAGGAVWLALAVA